MSKIKFTTGVNAGGTSLAGYIKITHNELVKVLGEGEGSGDKTLDEWSIKGEVDGEEVVATIYDWKNYGMSVHRITDWHIGGKDGKAVELIQLIFPNNGTIKKAF
jgi:uncharacterized protein YhfF